ncbi:uncharacterized protein DEA37_0014848 [Paragonimus westermani]|uniref:Calponin-homology (CH) domain-containing protein n=1 Tax=Paragonimus westermani TaxID=34504 RepID=A0A5J4NXM7_9TREM|nr:uncharacterized protein DEA37_0014848 [Paragonimus westermani]
MIFIIPSTFPGQPLPSHYPSKRKWLDVIDSACVQLSCIRQHSHPSSVDCDLNHSEPPIKIDDLFVDIRDGVALIRILEVLSKQKLVKLVNINPADIVDGKPAIVLGLIWSIILYFQIEEQEEILMHILGLPSGTARNRGSAKQILKKWVQDIFAGKYDVKVQDFGSSWRDGLAFSAMVHNIDSTLVQMDQLKYRTHRENLEHAFTQAETYLGIPKLLDPEDVDVERPDEKSIMTYVAQFFKAYPDAAKRKPSEVIGETPKKVSVEELIAKIRSTEQLVSKSLQDSDSCLEEHFIYSLHDSTLKEYNQTCQQFQSFEELLNQLKTEWKETAHSGSRRDSSELEIAEEALKSLQDLIDRWRWQIDNLAPGDFGTVAKWTSQAEQWLKATEDSWYQSTSSNKRRGMAGRPTESWRPSSADPPNSPPSFDRIETLLNEESEIFGLSNHRANSMRDLLSRAVEHQGELMNSEFIDQLGRRLSDALAKEPGYAACLAASKARRGFLDLLYATHITDTEVGVSLRSRRKASATGLEYRLADWNAVLEGSNTDENRDLVQDSLIDYEYQGIIYITPGEASLTDDAICILFQHCLETEKIPGKLEKSQEEIRKQHALLAELAVVNEKLPPRNALKVITEWIRDGDKKWNREKANNILLIGAELRRRLDAWDTWMQCTQNIERWLSHAERMINAQLEPGDDRGEVYRWIEEAQEATEFLGNVSDLKKLQQFKERLVQLDQNVGEIKMAEAQKLESIRKDKTERAEQELIEHLKKVEDWIAQTDEVLNGNAFKQAGSEQVCSHALLEGIRAELGKLLKEQPQARDHLQRAIQLVNNPPLQGSDVSCLQRLHQAENQMAILGPTVQSRVADLGDLSEKMIHIERNLEQLEQKLNQAGSQSGSILNDPEFNRTKCLSEVRSDDGHFGSPS